MSLNKLLYDTYKQIWNCELIANRVVSDETLNEFADLLNLAQPQPNTVEWVERDFTRKLYHSGKEGFLRWVGNPRNRVSALILWTESKRIVQFFNLVGIVHVSWDVEAQKYVVARHDASLASLPNKDSSKRTKYNNRRDGAQTSNANNKRTDKSSAPRKILRRPTYNYTVPVPVPVQTQSPVETQQVQYTLNTANWADASAQ